MLLLVVGDFDQSQVTLAQHHGHVEELGAKKRPFAHQLPIESVQNSTRYYSAKRAMISRILATKKMPKYEVNMINPRPSVSAHVPP